jgi:hypothetical protein
MRIFSEMLYSEHAKIAKIFGLKECIMRAE